ncbi:DUF992 domain-containing protein [Bosea sp. (in: a-proteobacteria)]|uniref:DUF992 domain-containing protein n=1 Tax=Bosea sp. (in: a-proteobacteria) TaxID=1871050 RepID=UPI0025BFD1B3|nr:DUF992 domain-containing protein [Bosea sp. (in: a-proteobacteria)]
MSIRHSSFSLAGAALGCLLASGTGALAQSGPPGGRLSCTIGPNAAAVVKSQKPMQCRFHPRRGPNQIYTAVVKQFSVDLSAMRGTRMSWRVYGPYARAPLGALSGSYSAGPGLAAADGSSGPPILVGGRGKTVSLRPLAVQTLRGINIAIGVTGLDLTLNTPRRRR